MDGRLGLPYNSHRYITEKGLRVVEPIPTQFVAWIHIILFQGI